MKIGLSTYSLVGPISSGEMTVVEALEWMKEHGCEQAEIVPAGFNLHDNPELIPAIREKAAELDLELSCYSIGGAFLDKNDEEWARELERLKSEIDVAAALGCSFIRHDLVAWRAPQHNTIEQFDLDLPLLAKTGRLLAEYGASKGIVNLIENHGYYVNGSERVIRLLKAVDHPNFKFIVDMGNLICVDEDPLSGVKKMLPYIGIMHAKDFYVRPESPSMGRGWFPTTAGRQLRGSVFGSGDLESHKILAAVKASGFDGYMSLEFEGMEAHTVGSDIGLENLRRIWSEA